MNIEILDKDEINKGKVQAFLDKYHTMPVPHNLQKVEDEKSESYRQLSLQDRKIGEPQK